MPCTKLGQRVRAHMALKPGAQATDGELIDWAAKSIAAFRDFNGKPLPKDRTHQYVINVHTLAFARARVGWIPWLKSILTRMIGKSVADYLLPWR